MSYEVGEHGGMVLYAYGRALAGDCDAPYETVGSKRAYRLTCGECARCLTYAEENPVSSLTEQQRACLYALHNLGEPSKGKDVVAAADQYLHDPAPEGRLSRVFWEELGANGLVGTKMIGGVRRWALTRAGHVALSADGHSPRRSSDWPESLF